MSKHREALRRGIRSLIRETSRELADLEGREAPSEAVPEGQEHEGDGHRDAVLGRDGPDWGGPHGSTPASVEDPGARIAAGAGPAADRAEEDGSVLLEAEVLAVEVREVTPRRPGPAEPREGGVDRQDARGSARDHLPAPTPAAAPGAPGSESGRPAGGYGDAAAPPPARSVGGAAPAREDHEDAGTVAGDAPDLADRTPAAPHGRTVRPRERASRKRTASRRRAHRARRRSADRWAVDGVDPRQVHTRHGVCSAYFVNPECWRVPDAYCNTALHVCAMRNCPVYHLHHETLERRFADKYKHLW